MAFVPSSNIIYNSTPVSLTNTTPGQNSSKNWVEIADGASTYTNINPKISTTGTSQANSLALGSPGTSGDYIKTILINVLDSSDSSVFLQDGTTTPLFQGLSATNPAGTTSFSGTLALNTTQVANTFANKILTLTYTSGGGVTTIRRRIVSHAAISYSASVTLEVDHVIPAGTSVTDWKIEQDQVFEIFPSGGSLGFQKLDLGVTSRYGGWTISTGSGVKVNVIGKYS